MSILIGYRHTVHACIIVSLLPLPCQAVFHSPTVRAAVFVTNDVCLSRGKPEMGALALPWCL